MIELLIQNGNTLYAPPIEDGLEIEWARKGSPGKLTFTTLQEGLKVTEGNAVRLTVDGKNMFYGFVFSQSRGQDGKVQLTAYDQLIYLKKNKDTYQYGNKTASDVIRMISADYELNVGDLDNTQFVIAQRLEDNKTLFDIVLTALDLTLQNATKMYVFYDDFGKLTLRDIENMKLNLLIDSETGQSYDYSTSIDNETYNRIKLIYENKDTGKRDVYISQDGAHMNEWGILQYFEKIDENVNGKAKADALLALYNVKNRQLSIQEAIGDTRVRAGCSLVVKLSLGDMEVSNFMIVDSVKHTFKNGEHWMDLKLIGGGFNG